MSMDWESHRVVTNGGQPRGLVFTLTTSFVLSVWIDNAARKQRTFYSMAELEKVLRRRRWRLEKVTHFA
jgi:hypothetical protein